MSIRELYMDNRGFWVLALDVLGFIKIADFQKKTFYLLFFLFPFQHSF